MTRSSHHFDHHHLFKSVILANGTVQRYFKKGRRWYKVSDGKYIELLGEIDTKDD